MFKRGGDEEIKQLQIDPHPHVLQFGSKMLQRGKG